MNAEEDIDPGINHKDIEKLEQHINKKLEEELNENTEALEDLANTIRGNGDDGLLARVHSLEIQMQGIYFTSGALFTGFITGLVMLLV